MKYLRVISGSARGTKLATLSGNDVIRPTTDRVKESVFNIIQFSVKKSRVLDVFCGSGALGIEALSRGAQSCVFVDSNRDSIKIAESNLKKTHLEANGRLIKSDYRDFLSTNKEKYDIIFADPPYTANFYEDFLSKIDKYNVIADGGVLIVEAPLDYEPFEGKSIAPVRISNFGKTKILFYKQKAEF